MKITHVAEIVNITNVAGILEAEICGAENMRAVLMYNQSYYQSKISHRNPRLLQIYSLIVMKFQIQGVKNSPKKG